MNPLIIRPGLLRGNNLDTRVARLIVHQGPGLAPGMSQEQEAMVDHIWFRHLQNIALSVAGYHVQDATLPDGTVVRIESNSGLHTVEVWPVGRRSGGGFPPLWVLVNVCEESNTPYSIYTADMRSYLYKLPPSLGAAGAEAIYAGSTVTDLLYTPAGGVNYTYSTSIAEDGDYGCISSFVPYNGQALYVGSRAEFLSYIPRTQPANHTIYRLSLNGVTQTHTVLAISDTVYSGTHIHHPPRVLEDGEVAYSTRTASSIGGSVPGTEVHRRCVISETPTFSIDPDGINPYTLSPSMGSYTRRQVGRLYQTNRSIFTFVDNDANAIKSDRGFNTIATAGLNTIPYTNNLVVGFDGVMKAGVFTYDGAKVASIDLSKLPGLDADDLYASYTLSEGYAARPDDVSTVYRTSHFLGAREVGASMLVWRDAADGADAWNRRHVAAVFIPDLYYHWDKT